MDSQQDEAPIVDSKADSEDDEDVQIEESSSQNSFKSRGDFDPDDYGSQSEDEPTNVKKSKSQAKGLNGFIKEINEGGLRPVGQVIKVISRYERSSIQA